MKYAYIETIDTCLSELKSSIDGLTTIEAEERLKQYGENQLPEESGLNVWWIFFSQFISPLIYILLFAGIVTVIMQEYSGAIFIFAVLLVNAIIGTILEYSANNAATALKKMVTLCTSVKRGGIIRDVDTKQLVIGDIVLLETGNKVPADIRLIEVSFLKVDESLLTGESKDVIKHNEPLAKDEVGTAEQLNMVFAGSIITNGRAIGVVVATGINTHMGQIAKRVTEKSKVKSPLIIRIERFTKQISIAAGVIVISVSIVLYIQQYDIEYIFMLAVGLAVAAIPEGLPVVLTVALAMGMRRMAKRNVIVRKLMAVESLGSCTIIASDKTGTLTRNELSAENIILPTGENFIITGGDNLIDGNIIRKSVE